MPVLRGCSALVIRCFKRVEHAADWLTGAAGPVFIFLCWVLISLGGFAFFDVIGRGLQWSIIFLLSPILVLVPLNLYVQYYLVTHVPPGFPSPRAIALSPNPIKSSRERWLTLEEGSLFRAETWGFRRLGHHAEENDARMDTRGRRVRRCRKCDGPKPERTHHCSVCRRCVLLMDHHCPWINGCVGLYNQRHFVLFMFWLSLGCWVFASLGLSNLWESFSFKSNWTYYTPRLAYTLVYILCIAMGVAVPVLGTWHVFMVSRNETSIESHDNSWLEGKAKSEGMIYLNPYDLGRRRNLELFFNVGVNGYSRWTLLLPLVIPPASNGWSFPRRALPADAIVPVENTAQSLHAPELAEGLVSSHMNGGPNTMENGKAGSRYVMGDDGSFTDDEEGGGGWMD
ncbi:DHHC palmitoyltransferase-domain-containing protein [Kockovaella imperatae]|uniref:Palmitoyltransferase n=1 Tax=Kockovaella imperatae TaxID=4999 RepID=A0A1Y1UBJ3_9TREE|nr:DHHC palmitoyltransferase-domain-containing protein [Kockovaella imperatae]ORX35428.1 DHHC palmitoyltransferase-domain-containing protein [Kockovaella imperatae]